MVDLGKSYLTVGSSDSIPQILRDYEDKLRPGNSARVELAYFKRKSFGFGLHYSQNSTGNSIPNLGIYIDSVLVVSGKLADDVKMSLYGLSVYKRHLYLRNQISLLGTFVFGLMTYDNRAVLFNVPKFYYGSTLGLCLSFGADFILYQGMGLGLTVSYYRAHFTGIANDGVTQEFNPNSGWANRIEAGLGLRFQI